MAYLDDLSQLLTTYRGRDKVLKLLCYVAKLISYQEVYEGSKLSKKLQIFSSKLSASRTVLRLFDDIPTIRNCLNYGFGKHEVNGIVRILNLSLNLIQLTYGVVEKVSWCTNNHILERTDKRFIIIIIIIHGKRRKIVVNMIRILLLVKLVCLFQKCNITLN